jgi:hypothetical protein
MPYGVTTRVKVFHCKCEPDTSINNTVLITHNMLRPALWATPLVYFARHSLHSTGCRLDMIPLLSYLFGNSDSNLLLGNSCPFPRCLRWAFLYQMQHGHRTSVTTYFIRHLWTYFDPRQQKKMNETGNLGVIFIWRISKWISRTNV